MHIKIDEKVLKSFIAVDRVSDKIQINVFHDSKFVGGGEFDIDTARKIIKAIEEYINEIESEKR